MARFNFATQEEKEGLKARAEKLRPLNVFNLVATARGWEQSRPNGTLELLVSFAGLDELLGDVEPVVVEGAPVEVVVAPEPEIKPEPEVKEEPKVEEQPVVEAPKKKGGRPKKVEAPVEPTVEKAAE